MRQQTTRSGNAAGVRAGKASLRGVAIVGIVFALSATLTVYAASGGGNGGSGGNGGDRRAGGAGAHVVVAAASPTTPPPTATVGAPATATLAPPSTPTPQPTPAPAVTLAVTCASALPQSEEPMGWLLDLCLRGPAGARLVLMLTVCPAAVAPAQPTIMSVSPVTLDAQGAWQSMDARIAGLVITAPCAPPFTIQVNATGADPQGNALSASVNVAAG